MGSNASTRYRWQGTALLRATTNPCPPDLPDQLDVDDPDQTRRWLRRVWSRDDVRAALRLAAPVLGEAIEACVQGRQDHVRQLRRTAVSTASYLLRWKHRPTPLGLFAGTATAQTGPVGKVQWRDKSTVAVRPDAEWVTDMVLRLQRHPSLLSRLRLVANNVARVRGDRLVAPGPPADGHALLLAPVEISVRIARPVAAAMAAASTPVRYSELHALLHRKFPHSTAEQVDALLAGLVEQQFLISSLWPPMTTTDPLGHLCRVLQECQADTVQEVGDLVEALNVVREQTVAHPVTASEASLASVTARMRDLSHVTATPLLVDTVLDCDVQIPHAVISEVETALTALYRTTPQPYGYQHWRDYHCRFRARYGVGAEVPVMELVADSGLGLPAGYVGSAAGTPPKPLTDRDELLLNLLQPVLMNAGDELELTDATIDALAEAAGRDERLLLPRLEAAFEVHAPTTAAIDRGAFEVLLTATPRPGSSMAGRFAHLLPPAQQDALAATYHDPAAGIPAQLAFPPRRRRNENVTRTPRLLPHLIELSGHHNTETDTDTSGTIPLDDIAVTADARSFDLIQVSTGRRIDVRVLHALEGGTQTPPLARFLAEIATARHAAYKPFDFGAAARLPYLPRVRYRRTVLTQRRWLLTAEELPGRSAPVGQWDDALDTWRQRLHVPVRVAMVEHDQRLPLDLTHPVHRRLLRTHLDRHQRLELREVPDSDVHGWIGRAHEIWLSVGRPQPDPIPESHNHEPQPRRHKSARRFPGRGDVLHAQLHAHPLRYNEILTRYLPHLIAAFGDTPPAWWFLRHRETSHPEADQHLDLTLNLTHDTYGTAAEHAHTWAEWLHQHGLTSGLILAPYQPQTGRFGHGTASQTAHQVFAADSAAALAQIQLAEVTEAIDPHALAAASAWNLLTGMAPTRHAAEDWLITHLPRETGRLDRWLRDQTLDLTSPNAAAVLTDLPHGQQVLETWNARAAAVDTYRTALTGQREPLTVARSLLHHHHVRALGVDPTNEATTVRLVRAAALHHQRTRR